MVKNAQVISMYLLIHSGLIFFLYPADIIESTEVGHWIPILTGFAIHAAVMFVYLKGLRLADGQSVLDLFSSAGRTWSALLLAPVFVYLTMVLVITARAYSEIVNLLFLENTPLWATMALLLGVSAYVASLGIESIMRSGLLLFGLSLPFAVFVLATSFQNVDWHYLLPSIDRASASFSFLFGVPFLRSLFAFGGGFLFLGFIQPSLDYSHRRLLMSSLILLPLFLISVYVPLLTFGQNTSATFLFPFLMATDTVDVDYLIFERTTLFFMLSMFVFVLVFMAIVTWQTVRIATHFVNLPFKPAVMIWTCATFIACTKIEDWQQVERLLGWNTYFRLYAMFVIPAATLAIGIRYARKGDNTNEARAQ
ncbi:spore germination protein [Paenibacillus soyae]|uniref:Spore germination protein n=1 Tax=Paenibacillus soyae TaxID=2969249 RepID=A0A9X2MNY1_9BACL|nr:spore germination protein [Paenibacillus soyae]MCR2803760.1 spore germination protein [Paenibacillus soyae]